MINKLKQTLALVIAAAVLGLAGCASSEKKESGSYFDDAAITARVKTAFFNEPSLNVLAIGVTTEDKVVALSGSVKTRADRAKAAEVARNVEGVKRVKNDLKLY
jgi:osmotically-inducible protein OsmY